MRKSMGLFAVAALAIFVAVGSAQASIVDFQDSGGSFVNYRGGVFTDQGLTFSTNGYMYTVDGSMGTPGGANNGTNFLIDGYGSNYGFSGLSVTEEFGNIFSVSQLDLAISYYASSPQFVTLV